MVDEQLSSGVDRDPIEKVLESFLNYQLFYYQKLKEQTLKFKKIYLRT